MPKKSSHPNHEEEVFPDEVQGIVPRKAPELRRQAMSKGEEDEDAYDDEGLEALREDDEIEDWEEGFMKGAKGKGQMATCAHCDAVLQSKSKMIEKMVDGSLTFFCSLKCASKGVK